MDADELAARNGIGERIKAERTRLGLSPEDFAAKAGYSRATVFNWESGVRMPDAMALRAMHGGAAVDVQFVVTGERKAISTLSCAQQDVASKLGDLPDRLQQLVADVTHVTWLAFDARRSYDYAGALSTGDGTPAPAVHDPAPTYVRKKR